ncbi:MAG: hypothetical protein CFE44_19935 [Burkholderiales bacterium PBB4]|nr:MAG: hypothetical protein CFE44_19935 [Burkholderiales bacterium PBB4]
MSQQIEASLVAAGVLLIAILSAFAVDRICRRLSRLRRIRVSIILTVLSLPGLIFGIYYLHILPEMQWLYELRSLRVSEFLLAVPLAAAVAWSHFLKRPLALASYAAAVCVLFVPFAKPILRPLDRSQLHDQWEEDACLQSTESTCGPSSAATILRRLGHMEASETTLSRQAWSTASGTEAWYLARAIRNQGLRTEFQFNRFPEGVDLPGILGVRLGSIGHFIAIIRRDGDLWVISDPLIGKENITTAELNRRYQISDFFLHIE